MTGGEGLAMTSGCLCEQRERRSNLVIGGLDCQSSQQDITTWCSANPQSSRKGGKNHDREVSV